MKRVSWKVPYIHNIFFSKLFNKKISFKHKIRNSIIPANFFSKSFYLYNGKTYILIRTKPEFTGLKFGEFSISKKLGFTRIKKKDRKFKKIKK